MFYLFGIFWNSITGQIFKYANLSIFFKKIIIYLNKGLNVDVAISLLFYGNTIFKYDKQLNKNMIVFEKM